MKALYSTNNFPEFTGRICPAPCESACVLAINEPAVTIKNIEVAIIERAFEGGWAEPRPPRNRTDKTVAVVGSGPAGLAAADQLNRAGHTVTVLERDDRIGGLLRYGIPDFKLEKHVVDRRLELMKARGRPVPHRSPRRRRPPRARSSSPSTMRSSWPVGRPSPVTCRSRAATRRASVSPCPSSPSRTSASRVTRSRKGPRSSPRARTPSSSEAETPAPTASGPRSGSGRAPSTQIEILPKPPAGRTERTPWPVHPGPQMLSTSSSQAEGCERDWAVMSKEFLKDEKGAVRAIRAARADWSSGRPEEVPGSEFEMPAQLVLLGMGFLHPEHVVLDDLGVDKDERGNCGSSGYQTSREGVFVAGDMRRGQSLVVWAITEGRECAREVDTYLTGRPSLLGAKASSRSDVALAL